MSKILDGKKVSEKIASRLAKRAASLRVRPKLVIIQVGNLSSSNIYIRRKKAFGKKIGVPVIHKKYQTGVSAEKIIADISRYNSDKSVGGIMIQLPIKKKLKRAGVIETINPEKDVDGLTAVSIKRLFDNNESFVPATTKGIITLLEYYGVKFSGKKAVIVGKSALVGKPTALALLNRRATVKICDKKTKNLKKETKDADILIVATGRRNLIGSGHVSPGQIVVDVGINISRGGKITGDVDFENVRKIVRAITPVPGGVGPMTIVSLFQNLLGEF